MRKLERHILVNAKWNRIYLQYLRKQWLTSQYEVSVEVWPYLRVRWHLHTARINTWNDPESAATLGLKFSMLAEIWSPTAHGIIGWNSPAEHLILIEIIKHWAMYSLPTAFVRLSAIHPKSCHMLSLQTAFPIPWFILHFISHVALRCCLRSPRVSLAYFLPIVLILIHP